MVRALLPRSQWYRAALQASRWQGRLVAAMGGNGPFTTQMMLTFWMRELSLGGGYPVPYRVRVEDDALHLPEPKLYTWTHVPLAEFPLRVLLEEGRPAPAVVADTGNVVGREGLLVYGWKEPIQALPIGPGVLRRVQSTLRAGQSVAFLADAALGAPLSDIPLRIAARLEVPVVYLWAELGTGGVLEVTFRLAPHPYSRTPDELAENLRFLRDRNREALARLGWHRAEMPTG